MEKVMFKKLDYILITGLLAIFLSSLTVAAEKTIKSFTLSDYNGKKHSLADYKESKAIVVMFIATRCPVSNAYNSRMVKLYDQYHSKGVTFLGINSNKEETIEEIKKHSEEHGFKFPVLKDKNNVIADQFGASFTPEIYVLNSNFEILYHGRIDDSRREENVTSQDLRNALDEILGGKIVSVTETKAFGCSIKRVR
jgi:peroxiredoxin